MRVIFRILTSLVLRPYAKRVVAGYISVFGAAAFAIAIPRILGLSVNRMLEPGAGGVSQLYLFAIAIVLAGAARGLFAAGQAYIGESLSHLAVEGADPGRAKARLPPREEDAAAAPGQGPVPS